MITDGPRGWGDYPDTGCLEPPSFSTSCFTCPLPVCRYDMPHKRLGVMALEAKLLPLLQQGKTDQECAEALDRTVRTIARLRAGMGWRRREHA